MMKGQLAGLMRQAQRMQENMKRRGRAGRDRSRGLGRPGQVTMTCRHDVKRVAIDPSLLGDDKDMLEDLVAAAFSDALRRPRRPRRKRWRR